MLLWDVQTLEAERPSYYSAFLPCEYKSSEQLYNSSFSNPEPATSPLHSCPFQDPFGDHVKRIMQLIHDFMQLPPDLCLRKYGTQEYEADVVILNERGTAKQTESN